MEVVYMKIYLASGWFSEEQLELCEKLESFLDNLDYDVYKPRVDSNITGTNPTKEIRQKTFQGNIKNIDECDVVVANMTFVDKGVLFECGYAYAKGKDIIYFKNDDGKPFNLMLAESSNYDVAYSLKDLFKRLNDFENKIYGSYEGIIE